MGTVLRWRAREGGGGHGACGEHMHLLLRRGTRLQGWPCQYLQPAGHASPLLLGRVRTRALRLTWAGVCGGVLSVWESRPHCAHGAEPQPAGRSLGLLSVRTSPGQP